MKHEGELAFSTRIKAKYHHMLKKMAADTGLSMSAIIEGYLAYLYAQRKKRDHLLSADSDMPLDLIIPNRDE